MLVFHAGGDEARLGVKELRSSRSWAAASVRGRLLGHESVASSRRGHGSRLEEDVYRRRAASVERRRSARLSRKPNGKQEVCPFLHASIRAFASLSKAKGGVNPRPKEGRPAAAAGDDARPRFWTGRAGLRGPRHAVTTPRGDRAPSPRRTRCRSPSPGGRRARRRHPCGSARRRRRRLLLKARRRRALPWRRRPLIDRSSSGGRARWRRSSRRSSFASRTPLKRFDR